MKSKLSKALNFILPFMTVLLIILIWAGASKKVDSDIILPSVSKTFEEVLALLKSTDFYLAFAFTLLRSLIAFLISFVIAFAFAILSVKVKYFKSAISPIISIMRALPTVAIVLLLWVWTNNKIAPVIVTMLVVLPTTYTHLESAFFALDKTVSEAGRVDGANELSVFFRIELPQVLPAVYSGIGGGFSLNFKLMVAAEVIAQTPKALGLMLNTARSYYEIAQMLAIVCFTVVLGMIVEFVFNRIAKKSASWK